MCMSVPDMPEVKKKEKKLPEPPRPREEAELRVGANERRRAGRGTNTILTGPRGTSGSATTTGASVLSGTR